MRALKADAVALMRALELPRAELSLTVVTDRAIRRLNRDFRGKDRATDVLSFPQFDHGALPWGAANSTGEAIAGHAPLPLGDIVISCETATRQARELGIGLDARIRTLLIHGLLHLLGYDHERSEAEARRMFAREHELAAILAGGAPTKSASAAVRWSPAAMPPRRRAGRSAPRDRAANPAAR